MGVPQESKITSPARLPSFRRDSGARQASRSNLFRFSRCVPFASFYIISYPQRRANAVMWITSTSRFRIFMLIPVINFPRRPRVDSEDARKLPERVGFWVFFSQRHELPVSFFFRRSCHCCLYYNCFVNGRKWITCSIFLTTASDFFFTSVHYFYCVTFENIPQPVPVDKLTALSPRGTSPLTPCRS